MNRWNQAIQAAAIVTIFPTAAAVLVGLALVGRTVPPVVGPERPATSALCAGDTFVFVAGAGSGARVTRSPTVGGGEALHGETELSLGARARRRIVEDVALDARGWLVSAEIRVTGGLDHEGAAEETRMSLDAARGTVRVSSAAGVEAWSAPLDAPWVYAPPGAAGQEIATPVAAWVALRAAAASPWLRQIERARGRAWLVPREQIALQTEAGTTVVLGGDGADTDGLFVERVRSAAYAMTFVRVPGVEAAAR